MKLNIFVKIAFGVLAGGCVIYAGVCIADALVKKKDDQKAETNSNSPNNEKVQDNVTVQEQKCDDTRSQVYESMSQRNKMAKEVLTEIHSDMKKSGDNINQKKSEIEKMMENLKK